MRRSHCFLQVVHSFWPTDASAMPARTFRRSAFAAFFRAFRATLLLSSTEIDPLSTTAPDSTGPPLPRAFRATLANLRLSELHRLEHVVISSQDRSHFFRQVNGRSQTTQTFCSTFLPRSMTNTRGARSPASPLAAERPRAPPPAPPRGARRAARRTVLLARSIFL
jgi:hypothetical protein